MNFDQINYFQVLKFEAGMGVQCHAARSLGEEENHLTRRREDTWRLQTAYLERRQTKFRAKIGPKDGGIPTFHKTSILGFYCALQGTKYGVFTVTLP